MNASASQWASRELLLGVSLLLGAVRAFQMSAQQALTPLLVPLPLLQRAMAFSAAGLQAAIIGGPALGGLIFVAGADMVYATCAALFVAAGALVLRLRYDHVAPPHEPVSLHTLLAGVRFIVERKVVLGSDGAGPVRGAAGRGDGFAAHLSRATSSRSARRVSACCARPRLRARCWCRSSSAAGRWGGR